MRLWGLVVVWLVLLGGAVQAHEITFSHVDIALGDSGTVVRASLPIKALLHEQPSALPAGTTEASLRTATLAPQQQAALKALLAQRLHVKAGGRDLPLILGKASPAGDDVVLTAQAQAALGVVTVEANLFPDDSLAKVFVTVTRGGVLAGEYALDRQSPAFSLDGPARPVGQVVAEFVGEGVHHIFIGPDHILFVLALVLLGGRLWTQVRIITAFTLAHSLTLVLAALGVIQAPARVVESLIALSIVVVGVHDLYRLRKGGGKGVGRDPRILFAFGFGLVHGFGFASVLGELALPREALAWSLAAFNVGVEIGQAAIVLAAAPLLWAVKRYASARVARGVLMTGAGIVVLAGGVWFVQRAFGLAW